MKAIISAYPKAFALPNLVGINCKVLVFSLKGYNLLIVFDYLRSLVIFLRFCLLDCIETNVR